MWKEIIDFAQFKRREFAKNNTGIINSIQAIVIGAIFLLVGIYVYSTVQDAMPTPTSTELQNATTTTTSNVASGFTLMSVVFIVIAAAAILAVLVTGLSRRGQ
ncbi:MAG: hypothetical protein JRC90_10135 [Deltaproteobacteria bacterium]|nr:hypothetical protein [Deltaproteobacteria bacterium]